MRYMGSHGALGDFRKFHSIFWLVSEARKRFEGFRGSEVHRWGQGSIRAFRMHFGKLQIMFGGFSDLTEAFSWVSVGWSCVTWDPRGY